jgi:hypothetical protein
MGMPSIPRSRRISSRCVDTSASRALSSSRSRSHSRRSRSELAAFSRSSASSRLRFSRCAREYAALSYLWRKQQQEKKEKKKRTWIQGGEACLFQVGKDGQQRGQHHWENGHEIKVREAVVVITPLVRAVAARP